MRAAYAARRFIRSPAGSEGRGELHPGGMAHTGDIDLDLSAIDPVGPDVAQRDRPADAEAEGRRGRMSDDPAVGVNRFVAERYGVGIVEQDGRQ